jgi:hypothetical protein
MAGFLQSPRARVEVLVSEKRPPSFDTQGKRSAAATPPFSHDKHPAKVGHRAGDRVKIGYSSEQIAMGPALHPVCVWFEEQECGPCAKFAEDGPLFACAGGRLKIAESVAAPGQFDADIRCLNPGAILHEKVTESHGGSDLE